MTTTTTTTLFSLSSQDKLKTIHLLGYLWLLYSGLVLHYSSLNPFFWSPFGKGVMLAALLYILLYISYKILKKSLHHAFTATLLTLCSFIPLALVFVSLLYFSLSPLYLLPALVGLYGYLKSSVHLFSFRAA